MPPTARCGPHACPCRKSKTTWKPFARRYTSAAAIARSLSTLWGAVSMPACNRYSIMGYVRSRTRPLVMRLFKSEVMCHSMREGAEAQALPQARQAGRAFVGGSPQHKSLHCLNAVITHCCISKLVKNGDDLSLVSTVIDTARHGHAMHTSRIPCTQAASHAMHTSSIPCTQACGIGTQLTVSG